MKISVLNISPTSTGTQVVAVPKGARLRSAIEMSGVVQVYYSYDGPEQVEEPVEMRVVDNMTDYPDDYAYLALLVNSQNKQVSHVVYKQSSLVHVSPA